MGLKDPESFLGEGCWRESGWEDVLKCQWKDNSRLHLREIELDGRKKKGGSGAEGLNQLRLSRMRRQKTPRRSKKSPTPSPGFPSYVVFHITSTCCHIDQSKIASHRNHRRTLGFLPDEYGLAGFLSKDSRKSFQRDRRQWMIDL